MPKRIEVLETLIDRFNAMLDRVCGLSEFAYVRHMDLRKTLSSKIDYKQGWANELHPPQKGFEMLASKFASAIG